MSNSMNRVHATLGKDAVNNILRELSRLEAQMPMLQNLNSRERAQVVALGDGNRSFVEDAVEMLQRHPELLPGYVTPEEVVHDYQLYQELDQIARAMTSLLQKVNDTRRLAGGEAMQGALIFYRSVRHASQMGVANSKALYDELKTRFVGQGRAADSDAMETDEAEDDNLRLD